MVFQRGHNVPHGQRLKKSLAWIGLKKAAGIHKPNSATKNGWAPQPDISPELEPSEKCSRFTSLFLSLGSWHGFRKGFLKIRKTTTEWFVRYGSESVGEDLSGGVRFSMGRGQLSTVYLKRFRIWKLDRNRRAIGSKKNISKSSNFGFGTSWNSTPFTIQRNLSLKIGNIATSISGRR